MIAPDTNLQANRTNLFANLDRVDGPWDYGYKDHAIGVRKDFDVLKDVLDFWIHELILSPPEHRHSSPWSFNKNSYNMDELYKKWVCKESNTCDITQATDESTALGISHFDILWRISKWLVLLLALSTVFRNRDMIAYRFQASTGMTLPTLPSLIKIFTKADGNYFYHHCLFGIFIGVIVFFSGNKGVQHEERRVLPSISAFLLWCVLQTPVSGGWVSVKPVARQRAEKKYVFGSSTSSRL